MLDAYFTAAVSTNTLCGIQLARFVEKLLTLATLDIALGPFVDWCRSRGRSRSRSGDSGLSGFRHFVGTD